LESVEIERQGRAVRADTLVADTRLQIRLDHALAPHGGKLNIRIRYHYTVPGEFGEFYLEYGDFDYFVTVPWDMLVAASGELQNPGSAHGTRARAARAGAQ
jgi:hypothetical protein